MGAGDLCVGQCGQDCMHAVLSKRFWAAGDSDTGRYPGAYPAANLGTAGIFGGGAPPPQTPPRLIFMCLSAPKEALYVLLLHDAAGCCGNGRSLTCTADCFLCGRPSAVFQF